jgi:hypothetical protein
MSPERIALDSIVNNKNDIAHGRGSTITLTGAAYLYYLQPYINKVIQLYEQVSGVPTTTTYQSPDINKAVEQFVKSLAPTQK